MAGYMYHKFGIVILVGIVALVFGVVNISQGSYQFAPFAAIGTLAIIVGLYQIGESRILFDDELRTIFMKNSRWCFLRKTQETVGDYESFRGCMATKKRAIGDDEGKFTRHIEFVFLIGKPPKHHVFTGE